MIVVSDTTPIISLIKIQKLSLLQQLFGTVLIPESVYTELTTNLSFAEEAKIVQKSDFLKTVSVQNKMSVKLLQQISGLDNGESEAIILMSEQNADLLIMDERKGRKVATKIGLAMTGTVGVLVQAFNEKLLSCSDIENCLYELRKSNIRISDNLIQQALTMIR